MTARREPAASIRVVYLTVERKTGKPARAFLTRDAAREHVVKFSTGHRVVRCEVLPTKRAGGGA